MPMVHVSLTDGPYLAAPRIGYKEVSVSGHKAKDCKTAAHE